MGTEGRVQFRQRLKDCAEILAGKIEQSPCGLDFLRISRQGGEEFSRPIKGARGVNPMPIREPILGL